MMIWLRVKVNGTRLCTAVHFARNKIKYQKSCENELFQYKLYACTIACFHLYRSIKEVLQMLPLAVPFIEIGGKQKITIASTCDKKETLYPCKTFR